jgi:hypothetical protein
VQLFYPQPNPYPDLDTTVALDPDFEIPSEVVVGCSYATVQILVLSLMSSPPNFCPSIQLKQDPGQIPRHSKLQFLTGLHAKTTQKISVIKCLLREDCVMTSYKYATFLDLLCEGGKGRIPFKRKAKFLDHPKICLNNQDSFYSTTERSQGTPFRAITLPAEKTQKKQLEQLDNSSYGTLLTAGESVE